MKLEGLIFLSCQQIVKVIKNPFLKRTISLFLSFVFRNPDYDYIVGLIATKNSNAKSKILAHALDYDLYLEDKSKLTKSDTKGGILFIDSDYVFHPDYKFLGINPPCTEEKYYPEVNYFLENLSNTTNLNVSIQLHPKADPNIAEKCYKFQVSILDTVSAIKNCRIVVAHDSTAISLAVLYNKPIILFQTSEICESFYYKQSLKTFHAN